MIENNNIKENCVYEFDNNSNIYHKNYRIAYCMNCKTKYEINLKIKHYLFFGLIYWKTINLYNQSY